MDRKEIIFLYLSLLEWTFESQFIYHLNNE